MYNEVWKRCPECGHSAYMQIPQIVLGFGNFNLDNPESIAEELSESEIETLFEYIGEDRFECKECGNCFKLNAKKTNMKIEMIKRFIEGDVSV